MKLNGMDTTRCPQLNYGEINHVDLTEIGNFVTQLAQAGVLIPDANLEHYLRDLAGLPEADHDGASYGAPAAPGQEPGIAAGDTTATEGTVADQIKPVEGTEPLQGDTD
jgi:hypothetical protein